MEVQLEANTTRSSNWYQVSLISGSLFESSILSHQLLVSSSILIVSYPGRLCSEDNAQLSLAARGTCLRNVSLSQPQNSGDEFSPCHCCVKLHFLQPLPFT